MTLCRIALGGNEGDVSAAFAAALRRLEGPDLWVTAVSRLYATPPMGADAGGAFLNAAATVNTSLAPLALLDRLLAAEDALGRVRTVRWGPRSIDLDLILYGDAVIDVPRLRVPHPAAWHRRFVLDPLCDIAPDALHPETGETIAALRDRLVPRPLPVAVDADGDGAKAAIATLRETAGAVAIVPRESEPAFTIRVGSDGASTVGRVIAVPADAVAEAVRAIVAAAVGVPEPVGSVACPPRADR